MIRRTHPLDDVWRPSTYYRPSQPSISVIEPHADDKKAAEAREKGAGRRHPFGFGVRDEPRPDVVICVICVACADATKACICGARPPRELAWPGA